MQATAEQSRSWDEPLLQEWVPLAPAESDDIVREADFRVHFRLVTYNTLAQSLIRRSSYPYASKRALKWQHRKKVFEAQVQHLNADVLCMQEVEYYNEFWSRVLARHGYKSYYKPKANFGRYGLVVAFKSNRFRVVDYEAFDYGALVTGTEGSEFEELSQQDNVAQMIALEMLPSETCEGKTATSTDHRRGKRGGSSSKQAARSVAGSVSVPESPIGFVVLNTHLFWKPSGSYVRAKQVTYALQRLLRFRTRVSDVLRGHWKSAVAKIERSRMKSWSESTAEWPSPTLRCPSNWELPALFCGDLNFCPDTMLYRMLTVGVPGSMEDFVDAFLPHRERSPLVATVSEGPEPSLEVGGQASGVSESGSSSMMNSCCTDAEKQGEKPPEAVGRRRERLARLYDEVMAVPVLTSVYAGYQAVMGRSGCDSGDAEPMANENAVERLLREGAPWKGEPSYTNAWSGFTGTLDYILMVGPNGGRRSDLDGDSVEGESLSEKCHLRCRAVVEVPDLNILSRNIALPSEVLPSDHVPIGATFQIVRLGAGDT